jgi:hypothetical protein
VSAARPKLYDDYTDLHGGIDSLTNPVTLEEIKKMVEGKERGLLPRREDDPSGAPVQLKEQFPPKPQAAAGNARLLASEVAPHRKGAVRTAGGISSAGRGSLRRSP